MKYVILEDDKELLQQPIVNYKMRISIVKSDMKTIITSFTGVSDFGTLDIQSSSDIRRTCDFTLKLDDFISDIENEINTWLGFFYKIDLGVEDYIKETYSWYPAGIYRITGVSTTYNATENSLKFSLSDRISELNGTVNGQIGGAISLTIPVEYNGAKRTIREIVSYIIQNLTTIKDYIIEDVGEYYGMPGHNSDYLTYRQNNSEWNILPSDLTYNPGDTLWTALGDIRDLYPDCQAYMDVYGAFCFNMLPTMTTEIIDIDNSFLRSIQTSDDCESVEYDTSNIKNITEIFGVSYDVDFYATFSSFASNIYQLTLSAYTSYDKSDIIAFVPSANNTGACNIQINSLGVLPIYYEYTTTALTANEIENGETCAVKIYTLNDSTGTKVAYYLGQYQPHALCVFTNDVNDTTYTKTYFSNKYNIDPKNVIFRIDPTSKFSVQNLGEVLESHSGDNFDNILSNTVAKTNAAYYNRKSTTMMDTVSITTLLVPFLDVNIKVSYKKRQNDTEETYIVTEVSNDFSKCTSTITMYKFLQLYDNT